MKIVIFNILKTSGIIENIGLKQKGVLERNKVKKTKKLISFILRGLKCLRLTFYRDVFRTLSNNEDGAFCENSFIVL